MKPHPFTASSIYIQANCPYKYPPVSVLRWSFKSFTTSLTCQYLPQCGYSTKMVRELAPENMPQGRGILLKMIVWPGHSLEDDSMACAESLERIIPEEALRVLKIQTSRHISIMHVILPNHHCHQSHNPYQS